MQLEFYKFQGTGNDFVMIDNRKAFFPKENQALVASLCQRKYGIGADGLILIEEDADTDFKMVYFNADGREGSMCGNGGRCAVAFAKYLGIVDQETQFMAVDGLHHATITDDIVSLHMIDVADISQRDSHTFLDTGSPHHVQLVSDLQQMDVAKEGAKLRYGLYGEQGSNINFVEQPGDAHFKVRTYERGVEDETLSCGTGVTAVALSMYHLGKTKAQTITVETQGGPLEVRFEKSGEGYREIYLTGPAKMAFKGSVIC